MVFLFSLTLVFKALNGILGEGILIPWRNALFADILAWRRLRIYESYSLTHLIHAMLLPISRLLFIYSLTTGTSSVLAGVDDMVLKIILCSVFSGLFTRRQNSNRF